MSRTPLLGLAVLVTVSAMMAPAPALPAKDPFIAAKFQDPGRIGAFLQRTMDRQDALKSEVPVTTVIQANGDPAAATRSVIRAGGSIQAHSGNLLQALLTVDQIRHLADDPSVAFLRLPYYARPMDYTSEGVATTSADRFHAAGDTGSGVRIAVLDIGFSGYSGLIGSELPSGVQVKNFNGEGFETTPHGTAVAEALHDQAPGAELALVAFRTDVEFAQAVDWILAQRPRFDIVNASIGFDNVGPLDGTSSITRTADRLLDEGNILMVASAGNERQDYYSARFHDPDDDGWHNFADNDETLDVTLNSGELVDLILNWDDWGETPDRPAATEDYDLYVWCPGTEGMDPADACLSSAARQDGETFDRPLERLKQDAPASGGFRVGIRRHSGAGDNLLRLSILGPGVGGKLEYSNPHSTLTLPADGESVLAAGAYEFDDPTRDFNVLADPDKAGFKITDWQADLPPESYSSMGPTWDGRIKPDLSGPDCVSTTTFGPLGFCGTSAAAPHVSGAAALLKAEAPSRSGHALKRILIASAEDVLPRGADNAHGAGRLSLDAAADKPGLTARSGLWNNSRQVGHGFFLEVRGNTLVAAWYVYDAQGDPYWVLSSGPMAGENDYSGPVYTYRGPRGIGSPLSSYFDAAGTTRDAERIGTLNIHFTGDATADVSVHLRGDELIGASDYQVQVKQFLTSPPASSSGLSYASPYSGLWQLPDQNGHGFFINRQAYIHSPDVLEYPTDDLIVSWFGYDAAGNPFWLLGSGPMDGAKSFFEAGKSIGERLFNKYAGPELDGTEPLDELFDIIGRSVNATRSGNFSLHFLSPERAELHFRHDGIDETLEVRRLAF